MKKYIYPLKPLPTIHLHALATLQNEPFNPLNNKWVLQFFLWQSCTLSTLLILYWIEDGKGTSKGTGGILCHVWLKNIFSFDKGKKYEKLVFQYKFIMMPSPPTGWTILMLYT